MDDRFRFAQASHHFLRRNFISGAPVRLQGQVMAVNFYVKWSFYVCGREFFGVVNDLEVVVIRAATWVFRYSSRWIQLLHQQIMLLFSFVHLCLSQFAFSSEFNFHLFIVRLVVGFAWSVSVSRWKRGFRRMVSYLWHLELLLLLLNLCLGFVDFSRHFQVSSSIGNFRS